MENYQDMVVFKERVFFLVTDMGYRAQTLHCVQE
jgi:hypothetical protein